jgi:uncharacterized membrane protein
MAERALHRLPLLGVVLAGIVFSVPCAAGDNRQSATAVASQAQAVETVAYYFHGNVRCRTCRAIEAYSEEAIRSAFEEELASGRLAWRVVNTDQPENQHFVADFELVTGSLVLAEYRDGKVTRWENLERVWLLVGDKEKFLDYVRSSTRRFLQEG